MSLSPISKHEKQLIIWRDPARFKVLCAGRRFGKTILAAEKLLQMSCIKSSTNIYVAPTRSQAKEIIWNYLKVRMSELSWSCKINESELKIVRTNNSTIQLMSAEKEARFRGRKINFVVLDEFAEYKNITIWNQSIRPALSDTRGQAWFLFTPKGFNHAYEIYNNATTKENWAAFTFKTIDSPFFQTPEGIAEIQDAKASLSDKDFKQEYEASFETFAGRIYYNFDRKNLHTDYKYDPQLPIIVGQDFNRSPMTSGLFQRVAGKLIQFSELFLKTADTKQTCEKIKQLYPNAQVIFRPDATGNRQTSNSSYSDFQIIKSFGFLIESAKINPRRVDRWAAINAAFEKKLVLINTKNCPYTLKDRENLVYKEGSCEANLNDPWIGHISDACDYAIFREFPPKNYGDFKIDSYI